MPLRRGPSARFKIKVLSQQLRKLTFPTSQISVKLARFAADAFDNYLSGNARTLDAAFGLAKKRGVPGWPKARLKMAKEVYALKKANKSWSQVQQELERQGYKDTDLGTIKRTFKEFRVPLMAKTISESLKADLQQDSPTTRGKLAP